MLVRRMLLNCAWQQRSRRFSRQTAEYARAARGSLSQWCAWIHVVLGVWQNHSWLKNDPRFFLEMVEPPHGERIGVMLTFIVAVIMQSFSLPVHHLFCCPRGTRDGNPAQSRCTRRNISV